MKISSASKKVLASALSAAMVVAFAPAVAFATPGDINVTIDLDGGTGSVPAYTQAEQGKTIDLSGIQPTKNGYALAKWVYDVDGDPTTKADNEAEFTSGSTQLPSRSDVTIKAVYSIPEATVSAVDNGTTQITTAKGSETPTHAIKVALPQTNFKDGSNYTVKVKNPDGTELLSKTTNAADAKTKAAAINEQTIYFVDAPLTKADEGTVQASNDLLVNGDYTVEVYDGDTLVNSSKQALAVATFTDEVSAEAKASADKKIVTTVKKWIAAGSKTATVATPSTSGVYWLDADGYNKGGASASINVKGGEAFTATTTVQTVSDGAYTANGDKMSFKVSDTAAASGSTAEYKAVVTGPDGATVFTKSLAASDVAATGGKALEFTFDQNSTSGLERTTATKAAGTYTCTVTKTVKKAGEDDAVSTSKASVKMTEVKVDAGAGSFATESGKKLTDAQKDYFVDSTATTATVPAADAVVAPEGKVFDKWTCGDAKAAASGSINITAGEVNTVTATYKDEAASTDAKAPTVASAVKNANGTYTIKLAAQDGVKIVYGSAVDAQGALSGTTYTYNASTGIDKYAASSKLYVQAQLISGATALKGNSKVVEVSWDQSAFSGTVAGAASSLEKYIGKSKVKFLAEDSIKAAIANGQAALDGQVANVKADWDKLVTAQLKGVYDAVAAYATTAFDAYESGANVIVGDKVYTMTAKQVTDAKAAVKKVTDKVAKDEAAKDAVDYPAQISSLVAKVNSGLNGAAENKAVKAADITAAQAVTEQLQAAKTADEAKAALEAYNKLSDAAKKLVSTADVTAAQKVVSDAESAQKLKDSQDLAAARDLNGKKVTAKAKVGKKAQGKSFTYALAASESGATASYAKVSGSKYIKISSVGKVTFSKVKVAKKAKTYKAKVSVTYGTQTVTKTVQLVVKKK